MHLRTAALLLLATLSTTSTADPTDSAEALVAAARSSCETLEGGVFAYEADYLVTIDLDGDGQQDQLVDESRFACSSSASLFAATGGSLLHAIVRGQVFSWQAQAWRIIAWGEDNILLLAEHGSECGGYGYQHCYEAVSFSEGKAMTVR
jgi:hypothetical protein